MDITAIVPCYNGEKFINTALDSIIAQSYPVQEIIFIDDGSIDDSLKKANLWCHNNSKIKVNIIQQQQQGVAAARNAGWKASKTEWVSFLDIDDFWYPNHNKALLDLCISQTDCVLAFCDADRYDQNGIPMSLPKFFEQKRIKNELSEDILGKEHTIGGTIYRNLLIGSFIPTCSTMVKKKALEELNGFEIGRRFGEDRKMWLNLFTKGTVMVSRECISRVIYHDDNVSAGNKTLSWQKENLTLAKDILNNASLYQLGDEEKRIINEHILLILENFKYSISCHGLTSMLTEGKKLKQMENVNFSKKDWIRAIYKSLTSL